MPPASLHEVAPPTDAERLEARGGVTPRIVVLCLALAAFFGYLIPVIDLKLTNTFLGRSQLPPGAVGALLVLLGAGVVLSRVARRWSFSRGEAITVYACCLFATYVPGHGSESNFVQNIIGSFYYATRANDWLRWLEPLLRPWLSPALAHGRFDAAGRELVSGWYLGTGGQVPWAAWLVPLVVWGGFIFTLYFMLACLAVMLHAQWARREVLRFPLLQLPLEMTAHLDRANGKARFWRDPLMWVGFGGVACVQLLNGLHLYFPEVPAVPLSLGLSGYSGEPPWNQLGIGFVAIWPVALGIFYLLTTEISFSLWFFFLFIKLQYVVAYYCGFQPALLPSIPGWWEKTFTGYQIIGAYCAVVGFALWTARRHLAFVLRRALGRARATPDEAAEAMPYPLAFWGFVLACGVLFGFGLAAGARPLPLLVMGVLFLVVAIAMARVVVEAGLFVVDTWPPLTVMGELGGAGPHTWLPPQSVLPLAFLPVSGFLLPSFLQAFRLADMQRVHTRRLCALVFGVLFVSLSLSIWMRVRLGYETGGHQLNGWSASTAPQVILWNSVDMMRGLPPAGWSNWCWAAVGTLEVAALYWLRARWVGFPLHPLGLLVPSGYMMNQMWFSIFLGWLCKTGIIKFGGHDAYRRATPLFIGITLGDVAAMLFWLVIDGWQGRSGHFLMPP